jgi:hypothetical protein
VLNTKPLNQRHTLIEELSEEETALLAQMCDIITIVTMERHKTNVEENQLLKLPPAESFGQGSSAEMYILLP